MNNQRFPHKCVITREVGDPQDGDLDSVLLYSGSCRRELRKFDSNGSVNTSNTSSWMLSVPIEVKVTFGDKVKVNDGIACLNGVVSDWDVTNIYHCNTVDVYSEDSSGNVTSLEGTTTKGMHLYISIIKN